MISIKLWGENISEALTPFTNINFQSRAWINGTENTFSSFGEDSTILFDDLCFKEFIYFYEIRTTEKLFFAMCEFWDLLNEVNKIMDDNKISEAFLKSRQWQDVVTAAKKAKHELDAAIPYLQNRNIITNYDYDSEIINLANEILESKIGIIDGIRKLAPMIAGKGFSTEEDFKLFFGIESETDEFPSEATRKFWNKEKLREIDKDVEKFEAFYKKDIFFACKKIIAIIETSRKKDFHGIPNLVHGPVLETMHNFAKKPIHKQVLWIALGLIVVMIVNGIIYHYQ